MDKMKTIKELETEIECKTLENVFVANLKGYREALKDVIKEIDELIEHNESMTDYERDEAVIIVLKELKARFI